MMRAELEYLKAALPKSNEKHINAHYQDLAFRINEALQPGFLHINN